MAQARSAREQGFTLVQMLVVLSVAGILSAIAIPFTANTFALFRLGGDARSLRNGVSMTKMRAASDFTLARFYVNLAGGTHHVEIWQKVGPPGWVAEGGTTYLSSNDSFGFGGAAVPPPDAPAPIGQAPPCLDNAGTAIAGTACVIFNSRGIPVDGTGAPTGADAIYITDGASLYGVTVSASGQLRLWRSPAGPTPAWTQQ